jgi:hypothetical protein
MSTGNVIERNAVIVACAISAGIHGALVPAHLAESRGAGLAFAAAAALLTASAAALTVQPSLPALLVTAALLAGLIGGYAVATTSGLPLMHPEPEPVDGLAIFTKAVEAVGLVAAAGLIWRDRSVLLAPVLPRPKGTPS